VPKANLGKRFIASAIDGFAVWLVSLIPIIGAIIGIIYLLTRDAVIYEVAKKEEFKNQSLGKHLMGLTVTRTSGEDYIDFATSAKRNALLAIGGIVGLILMPLVPGITTSVAHTADPTVMPYAAAIAGLAGVLVALLVWAISGIPVVIECLMVLFNNQGDRLGDRIAGTHVAEK